METNQSQKTETSHSSLGPVSGSFVAYQTFLIEAVNELLKVERSIVKDGYVKISIDEEYKCSDADLAKYKIEYQYPLHLIHLGQDLHRAELKLSDLKSNEPKSFDEAARPLIKWLCENKHPHVTAIVTPTSSELLEGLEGNPEIYDYVVD